MEKTRFEKEELLAVTDFGVNLEKREIRGKLTTEDAEESREEPPVPIDLGFLRLLWNSVSFVSSVVDLLRAPKIRDGQKN